MRVDLYPEADKLGKQFKYASARGIPFVAIVGDDERRAAKLRSRICDRASNERVKRDEDRDSSRLRERLGSLCNLCGYRLCSLW